MNENHNKSVIDIVLSPLQRDGRPHELGYFFHIANSRSGHHFVRLNIMSWVNQRKNRARRYHNLENFFPEYFNEISEGVKLDTFPSSVLIIQTRDLLN